MMYKHDYSIARIGRIVVITDRITGKRFFAREGDALSKILEIERKFRV